MAQQQSSRLNRLLTLLDTGSTQATRFTAARQIGDIAKSHPQDLNSLLRKVCQYLHSKNWDTRVAAAHAIGAIAQNVKHASVSEVLSCVGAKLSEAGVSDNIGNMVCPNFNPKGAAISSLRSFDINKVLEFGALLASGGQEYDIAVDNSKNPKERLARQKQNLKRRLGLDVCEQFMDVNDVFRDEDLIVPKVHGHVTSFNNRFYVPASANNLQQFVSRMVPNVVSKRRPSAREMNLLKRKAKINSKDQTKGWSDEGDTELSGAHSSSTPRGACSHPLSSNKLDAIVDDDSEVDRDGRWPFLSFVEQLILDMFDSAWEVRHGSIMALREILTHHGASAGVYMPEVTSDSSLCDVLKEVDDSSPVNIEQGLDLSLQGSGEVLEPNLKKPKIEDMLIPVISKMDSADQHVHFDQHVKMEDVKYTSHSGQLNGDVDSSSLKIEAKPYDDSILCQYKEADDAKESKIICEGMGTISNHVAKNYPNNSELITLVKLARTSWLKNCEFLQDCAIRFLCILSLDRFGDYVSDQVVAPVRETCAQALGAVFKYMHPSMVYETLDILLKMQCRPEWEIRHGSLLAIKYLVAVRREMMHHLLGAVLPACKAGLEDPDDDVRAASADALIPAASCIVALNGQSLHSIVMLLWDILLDLDDLSPSTSSVMNLLAEIYSQEMMANTSGTVMSNEDQNFDLNELTSCDNAGGVKDTQENPYMLSILAPRLWPFMRHSIRSVRHSAIRTLERLLQAGHRKSLSEPSGSAFWPSFILGDTLRIVFQNLLLESNEEILQCSERVWRLLVQCPVRDLEACAVSYISSWIELATTPLGSALDATKMFWPVAIPRKSQHRAAAKMKAVRLENEISANVSLDYARGAMPQEKNGDTFSASVKIVFGADTEMSVHYTRVVTASALGILSSRLNQTSLHYVINPIWDALTSMSGVQRQVASLVLISWFKEIKSLECFQTQKFIPIVPELLKTWLLDLLSCADPAFPTKNSSLSYSELLRHYSKMRHQAEQLVNAVKSSGMFPELLSANTINLESLSVDDAISFASNLPTPSNTESHESMNRHLIDDVESAKQHLISTSSILTLTQTNLHVTVTSLVAAAVVWMSELPAKLNPVILPLMASIRREQEEVLQQKSADALAELIYDCISRRPGPNDKLIKNICALTCADPSETPQANVISSLEKIDDQDFLSFGPSTGRRTRVHGVGGGEDRSRNEGFISRRGSEFVLKKLCQKFGGSLFDRLPKLWDCLIEVLKPAGASDEQKISLAIKSVKDPQALINNIQVVRSIAPMLDEVLKPRLLTLLPCVFECVRHSHVAVRLAASRGITSMAKSISNDVMRAVIQNAIPMLGDVTSVNARQGAGMLVSLLVQGLGVELVPYAPLLVVPLLRCMSDSDSSVRQSVTRSFAALVPLLPLARGLPTPPGLSEDVSKNSEDAKFLEQLLDNSHIDDYKLSAELKVNLRRYQQEGINWLAFLKRFKLHGILCDDMGLGKTLQASAIVASDIAERRISSSSGTLHPSLIVCPSTLVGHWSFEIEKYIDVSIISTLQYVGSAPERITLRESFYKHNIIITSYDVVRKDIDFLGELLWNYCILDEGHIIKNTKSKITVAIKKLKADHRLILSGTPIQNNIMDLWSLFDYLMPGFLGTERQFQATYGKPLLAARDPKCSAKDAEAGALAMEALHKQVMPFLLRRTKDEVLSDLPEKIIQDRYCDLSPVQLKLYEQFSGSQVKQEISSMVTLDESTVSAGAASSPKASTHVFQALQYLLKLCSHPLLVVGDRMPDLVKSQLSELLSPGSDVVSELHKLHHSPKLVALQEILEECGIGVDSSASDDTITVGQHRVLIFAQHKALLDIIEKDLFRNHMKSVTYLRLDGSVEPEKRFDIVKAFNSDPTIDVLLLTTHVGGLGLNLTSADTLVFMEHDWNPMRDHQAMDRAHRLGQRKVVHVHRLIMRGTLEEKVMNLQKFKVSIANAVINSENASLKTMNTDQLLDLFATAETSKKGGTSLKHPDTGADGDPKLVGTGKGLKAILGGLEELWDQSQYSEEYNLSQFLAKLNG